MRFIGSKLGVYIYVGRRRETKESLENQIRTLGNILGHFPSPPLIPKFGTLHQWTNNFGFPQRIELKFETQVHDTSKEVTPFLPCQSMRFMVVKDRIKFKGQLNSHDSQNPIKRKDMDLKILGRMGIELKKILGHYNYENKLIIKVKNHNPSKVEKGREG